jgi:hypothetical protein
MKQIKLIVQSTMILDVPDDYDISDKAMDEQAQETIRTNGEHSIGAYNMKIIKLKYTARPYFHYKKPFKQ